eukprot:5683279-Pyramimonas_sp.AAC.1
MLKDTIGADVGMHGGGANYVLEITVFELLPRFGQGVASAEALLASGSALWNMLCLIREHKHK